METKLSEGTKVKNNPQRVVKDTVRIPGRAYFLTLAVTVILLIAFLATFLVFFFKDGATDRPAYNPSAQGGNNPQNSAVVVDKTSKSIGGNIPGRTVPKRASYISAPAANVSYISSAIKSENVILIDLDSYTSIAEKGADRKIFPASMTKVMSLLVACENLKSLSTKFTITQEVVEYSRINGGSGIGLSVGDVLDAQDLLYLTAYQSDTVAVITLATHIAGNETGFVNMMNEKAASLGLTKTRFANCTGLYDDNNYTTCREMAAIFAYALENPLCKELLTSYSGYSIDAQQNRYTVYSSWYSGRFGDNPRLNTVTVLGGKTGYIDESGFCLVSLAQGRSSGKSYIQVIVGQPKGSGLTEELSVQDIRYVYDNFAK